MGRGGDAGIGGSGYQEIGASGNKDNRKIRHGDTVRE